MAAWLLAVGHDITAAHRYSLLVESNDVIGKVPADTLTVGESGAPGMTGTFTFTVEDVGRTLTLRDGAEVQFWDNTNNRLHFGGMVTSRRVRRMRGGQGRATTITATSWDAWLDWRQIINFQTFQNAGPPGPAGRIKLITSDKSLIQVILARYGGPIRGDGTYISETRTDMEPVSFQQMSLRAVLEAIGSEGSAEAPFYELGAPSVVPRFFYVDHFRRLHFFKRTEATAAPYRISDGFYGDRIRGTGGLAAYWPLGESSGSFCTESRGLYPAYLYGGYTRGGTVGVVNEPQLRSTTFDGSTAYAVATGTDLHPGDTFTIELWFKRSTTGTEQCLISAGTDDYEVEFSAADKIAVRKQGVGNNFVSTASYTDTSWHHLLIKRSPGSTAVYVDGVSIAGTTTAQTFIAGSGVIDIGRRTTGSVYFAGSLQHIAIYSTALPES